MLPFAYLFALALVLFTGGCDAHGFLQVPASRNLLAHLAGGEYDHMSLNGGGPSVVWPSGSWVPGGGGNHPICGRDVYATPGPSQAMWTPGQTVSLQVTITAPHAGHLYFGICPRGQESPQCFASHRLTNAADNSQYFSLKNQGGQYYGAAGTYQMLFRLPTALASGPYTMQWYYLTGNSCDPPGASPTGMGTCGAGGATPEEFWNCADVTVLGVATPPPPPPRAKPSPPPPKIPKPNKKCQCPRGWRSLCQKRAKLIRPVTPACICPAGYSNVCKKL